MYRRKSSSFLSHFVLLALLAILSSTSAGPSLLKPTLAQGTSTDLSVELDVKINALPPRVYLPLIVRNFSSGTTAPLEGSPNSSGSNAYARAGSWLRYVVTYENPDTYPSALVTVKLDLPSDVAYCAACNTGWTPAGGNSYAYADVPLAPGEQRTVTLHARVSEFQDPGTTDLTSQVTLSAGPQATAQAIITIAATFSMGPTHAHPKGLAADPGRNLVYAGIYSTGELAVIDVISSTIAYVGPFGLETQAQGVAYLNDKIYVVNPDISAVSVISAGDYSLVTTIDTGPGTSPFGIAAAGNRVYVSNFADNSVSVIDATSDTVIATAPTGGHPCMVAAFDDRAYVANHSHFGASALGMQAQDADPVTVRALAAQYAQQYPNDTGITVVYTDGTTSKILTETIGFFGVAVDPTRNLVYATQRDFGHEGLYVISGTDHSLIRHIPLSKPYAVTVNPNTNRVFVVMGQPETNQVYTFDGNDNYSLIRTEDVLQQSLDDGMMNGGQGVAVLGDWVYVANYGDDSMTSFPDAPATPPEYDPAIGAPFVRTWLYDVQQPGHRAVGLPIEVANYRPFTQQEFEHGFVGGLTYDVLYLRDNTGSDDIFELKAFTPPWDGTHGQWRHFVDTWISGMPTYACWEASLGHGVKNGFGIVWCYVHTAPGYELYRLGDPARPEWYGQGSSQRFTGTTMLWSPEPGLSGHVYVLYDDGEWHAYPY